MTTVDGGLDREITEAERPDAPVSERPQDVRKGRQLQRPRQRTLTVSAEGALLRAVAFSGSRIVAWATIDLDDPEGASLPPELAAFAGGRARQLTDLPFYASLVRYLEKPAAGRRFMDQVVAVEVGNTIPFALEEVDLQWRIIGNSGGPEVMAWAVPRWEIDAYVELVGLVGVRPSASYAKALALAAVAGRSDAAIAHLTGSEAELVLVRDGVPRRVHRVELPPAPEDAASYAGALAQAIEELCSAPGPDAPDDGATVKAVVLTGQVPADPAHAEALAETFGERLLPPVPSLDYPAGFPALEYAANVGLMLADRDRPRLPWQRSPAQRIVMDLLPPRHRGLRVPTRAIGIALLFGALAAGALAATSFVQRIESWADTQEASLASVYRQVRVSNAAAAGEKSVRLELDVLAAQVQALDDEVQASRVAVAVVVERARALTSEPSVAVSDVSLAGGKVTVSGTTLSYRSVVAFADGLRAAGLFDELRTTSAAGTSRETDDPASSGGGGVAFNMTGSYSTEAEPDADEAP